MPKIAYLCHIYPWITQTFIFNEIKGLKANRVPLQVVAFKRPKDEDFAKLTPEMQASTKEAIYLRLVWAWECLCSQLKTFIHHPWLYLLIFCRVLTGSYITFSTFKLRLHAIQDFLRGVYLGTFLRQRKFTHVHAEFANHSATSAWVAHKLTGIPFSFRSHTDCNSQLIGNKIADAAFVFCISEYDKKYLISLNGACDAGKLIVDYLGIDVEQWQPDNSVVEEDSLILCVATFGDTKGQEYLMRACHLLKERGISFRTLLVGEGPDREMIYHLIDTLQLQAYVTIACYKPHNDVLKLMQKAVVFCLPCIVSNRGFMDGIPIVLMEAMSLGKACVSTTVSGIPELIEHGRSGLLVEPRDPEALAQSIEELLKNAELRNRLGKRPVSKF